MDRPFLEEEVRCVVFQSSREKAPNPDGFTMALYRECWDVVKGDLMEVYQEFYSIGIINKSTNATFIALVLKKG